MEKMLHCEMGLFFFVRGEKEKNKKVYIEKKQYFCASY